MCATTDCSRTNIRIENNIKFSGRVSRWHTASHWLYYFLFDIFYALFLPLSVVASFICPIIKKERSWYYEL